MNGELRLMSIITLLNQKQLVINKHKLLMDIASCKHRLFIKIMLHKLLENKIDKLIT